MSVFLSSRIATHFTKFKSDCRGGYAVEFAAIGSAFITLLLILSQFIMIYLARDSLALALHRASRALLTGNFQQSNVGATDQALVLRKLAASICGGSLASRNWMFSCTDLKIDVRSIASFSAASAKFSAVDDATKTWANDFGSTYTCPGPKSIAVVRAAVKYPVFAPALSFGLSAFADGSALLQSAQVFRVEPYQSNSGSGC